MQSLLERRLTDTAPLWPDICEGYRWVQQTAHILSNPDQRAALTVQRRLGGLLGAMTRYQTAAGALAPARSRLCNALAGPSMRMYIFMLSSSLQTISRRVIRQLRKRGYLEADTEDVVSTGYEPASDEDPELARTMAASVQQRLACGERAGQQVRRIGAGFGYEGESSILTGTRCARVQGFSLHANTSIPAHRRDQLARLLRYTARGAVALERLEVNANGDLLYTFTHPWSDGTTGITLSPMELLEKLAALVPLPRQHQVRYGGCLAPHSHLWAAIIPTPRQQGREAPADRSPSPHWRWARLLTRVFALDMARCPVCQQGRLRIIAAITAGHVIQTMLRHLTLAVDPPSMASARQAAFAWDGSTPERALRANVRPLQSVFLRLVPRLSVSVNTVIRVQLPRPLAADDDLPAPHPFETTLQRPTT